MSGAISSNVLFTFGYKFSNQQNNVYAKRK